MQESTVQLSSPVAAAKPLGFGFAAAVLALAVTLLFVGYLMLAAPGKWFPDAKEITWSAADLALSRGSGKLGKNEWALSAPEATGTALLSVTTNFAARDFPVIAWNVDDLPETASAQLLWRTDYEPEKLQGVVLTMNAGHLLPVTMSGNSGWIGHVTGIALLIHGVSLSSVHIHGAAAKPSGIVEIARDRLREWTTFEGWTGASINTVVGGAESQDLPLPLLLAASVAITACGVWLYSRRRSERYPVTLAATIAGLVIVAWAVLDARWVSNLARQVEVTRERYAGKSWREKHLAAEDGALFKFIESARAVLPPTPVRVFVAADADYFRDRAAYHLYPQNVMYDPYYDRLPLPAQLHRGDWLLVYRRRSVQYDPSQQRLRWDGNEPVTATLKLVQEGGALFEIQ